MDVIDLFAGAGGFSKGLNNAGIDIRLAIDSWQLANESYERNMKHPTTCMDLLDTNAAIEEISRFRPDLIAGGPPCQDFSSAGKRIEGGRANLTTAFAEIVVGCGPELVVMENVPRVRSSEAYAKAKSSLSRQGYSLYERVLDASLCGVPQIRKRFFMFGWKGSRLAAQELEKVIDQALSNTRLTVKEYLKDEIDISHYYRHPRNYARRAIFSVNEPAPTMRGVNRPVPPNYKRNPRDSDDPENVRALTSTERGRIQTFPTNWCWSDKSIKVTKSNLELLIGNAVPVTLAEFVGSAIREVFNAG